MKINLLYLLVPLAIGACYLIVKDLQGQSVHSFFGTAETEPVVMSLDEDVQIREVLAVTGKQVKKGDTLAIAYRSELENELLSYDADAKEQTVVHSSKLNVLAGERQTILAKTSAQVSELEAQIREIQVQDSMDQALKSAIYQGLKVDRSVSEAKIAALRTEIKHAQETANKTLRELEIQGGVSQVMTRTKADDIKQKKRFLEAQKEKLVLIAPIDGYIEQVSIAKGSLVPAFKEMLRIYPLKTNKVIGFMHETADIPFHIGDFVSMTSGARKTKGVYDGQIIAVSPKLVELPMRLRKFVEVRAWGREVIITVPAENDFYIGEKIAISLKNEGE